MSPYVSHALHVKRGAGIGLAPEGAPRSWRAGLHAGRANIPVEAWKHLWRTSVISARDELLTSEIEAAARAKDRTRLEAAILPAITTFTDSLAAGWPRLFAQAYAHGAHVALKQLPKAPLASRTAYAPDQPRDEHGQFSSGDSGDLTAYHGTSKEAMDHILANGFDAGMAGTAYHASQKGVVYITTDYAQAKRYAERSDNPNIGIVQVRIPAEEAHRLAVDPKFPETAKTFSGNIPASWITGAWMGERPLQADGYPRLIDTQMTRVLADGTTIYLVVDLTKVRGEALTAQRHAYSADQERDDKGQWTSGGGGAQTKTKADGTIKVRTDKDITQGDIKRVFNGTSPTQIADQMLAKVPGDLTVQWDKSEDILHMTATRPDGLTIERSFWREYGAGGELHVDHDLFKVPADQQGKGLAKDVLASSYETYRQLGVDKIETLANLNVGGYAWAKFGFSTTQPQNLAAQLRTNLDARAFKGLTDSQKTNTLALIDRYKNDPKLPWHVAAATTKDGRAVGKELLQQSQWAGVLNMRDPEATARLESYVGRR